MTLQGYAPPTCLMLRNTVNSKKDVSQRGYIQ